MARSLWRAATRILACMTILIVDDPREPSRKALELWLAAFGARVGAADDGEHALRTLETVTPDVILCDLGLPGMDSVTFARCVRAQPQWAGITLIAMSRISQADAVMGELRAAGFSDHLSKPFDLFGVVERLTRRPPHT
ncbi:MAG: response regulator [Candidatus Rokuibacteriota bacterium]